MARRVGNKGQGAAAPENELEVLHPERHLTLAGQAVVVREYGHVEWLRLLPRAEPLVAAIAACLSAGRPPTYEEALSVLVEHIDALMPLVYQAADLDADPQLSPDDGEQLLMSWWGVNGRFFVRRALNRVAVAREEQRILPAPAAARAAADSEESAGERSTPASAPTGTGALPTSAS